jgi:hypothetical protein
MYDLAVALSPTPLSLTPLSSLSLSLSISDEMPSDSDGHFVAVNV